MGLHDICFMFHVQHATATQPLQRINTVNISAGYVNDGLQILGEV